MRRREFIEGAGLLLGVPAPLHAVAADDDETALKTLIRDAYALFKGRDEARYRSLLSDDYLLLENGELMNADGDIAAMPGANERYEREDRFDFRQVSVTGDIGYLVYYLSSAITDKNGSRDPRYLESAVCRRSGTGWRIALLHSTRMAQRNA